MPSGADVPEVREDVVDNSGSAALRLRCALVKMVEEPAPITRDCDQR